jgi:CRP-like cAMP-binding protein
LLSLRVFVLPVPLPSHGQLTAPKPSTPEWTTANELASRLARRQIFAALPMDTMERLRHDLVSVAVGGDEILTQGDHGDRFYLIESGKVEILEDGSFRRAESEGESIAEIALLRDTPPTATVRAIRR